MADIGVELAQVTLEQSKQMLRLSEDLLAYGRELSVNISNTELVDLAAIGTRMVAGAAPLAVEKLVTLMTDIPGGLPEVPADADRLGQVLSNLLRNALQYTPPGSTVTVRVGLEPLSGQLCERESLRVSVSDQGPGISDEDAAGIFSAFVRGRQASGKGAGLGLSIAKHIVQAHGGRIWAESEPGQGATFHFTVPLTA